MKTLLLIQYKYIHHHLCLHDTIISYLSHIDRHQQNYNYYQLHHKFLKLTERYLNEYRHNRHSFHDIVLNTLPIEEQKQKRYSTHINHHQDQENIFFQHPYHR